MQFGTQQLVVLARDCSVLQQRTLLVLVLLIYSIVFGCTWSYIADH